MSLCWIFSSHEDDEIRQKKSAVRQMEESILNDVCANCPFKETNDPAICHLCNSDNE